MGSGRREISAGAVLFRCTDEGPEYLLLHHPGGHWDFPKGHVEGKESLEQTVRREVREETGITRLRLIEDFSETIRYFFIWRRKRIFKIIVFKLARTTHRKIKLSFEHQGFAWLQFEAAMRKLTFANAKGVLRKAHRHIEEIRC